jgi:hypothetical protein
MAYKVLGQVLTGTASAGYVINAVKDPMFVNMTTTTAATNELTVVSGTTGWRAEEEAINNTTVQAVETDGTIVSGVTTAFSMTAGGVADGGTVFLGYGTTTSELNVNTATAIPVVSGTTYYYGAYAYRNGTGITSITMQVRWFNSSSTFLSSSSISMDLTTGSYVRSKSSAVAPANAAWASILFSTVVTTSTSWDWRISAVHFSADSSIDTNFIVPVSINYSTYNAFISPYTYKDINVWEGAVNASQTVNTHTSPFQDLYTVPANSSATISTIAITNTGTDGTRYRIAVLPTGESLSAKHFITFDVTLSAKESHYLTDGITLPSSSKIQVSAYGTSTVFNVFGSEN